MFRYTDLHKAIRDGSLEAVKYLVEHCTDIDHIDDYRGTPLFTAVKTGSLEMVKYLVEHGADVNNKDSLEDTPLHTAVKTGSLEMVEYLIEHGADVNHKHMLYGTPLHKSIQDGSLQIVKYLVEHGADVNCAKRNGETPLDLAAKMRSLEMVEYLFENNGKVTTVGDDTWSEILYWACKVGKRLVVEYLFQHKVIKEITKYFGGARSPISIACYHGHTAVVQTLLKYNVDIRKEKKLECGNKEIISILNMELKKSLKHREKIQILQQMKEEELVKVRLC